MCTGVIFIPVFFFSSAGVWGRDRMSPERRDPKILEFHFPTIEKKKKGIYFISGISFFHVSNTMHDACVNQTCPTDNALSIHGQAALRLR